MSTATPSMNHTDLLIIGGGPAGLSAALTFARVKRPAIVYDSGLYRNAQSPVSHTIPAYDGGDPAKWREKARKEIEDGYDWVKFVQGKITQLRKLGSEGRGEEEAKEKEGRFEGVDEEGNKVIARKVVIATGISDKLPNIPGLQSIWGTRAIHCIFCHGTETRHSPLGFLLTRSNSHMNAMMVEKALELWPSLDHPSIHFLTHGMEVFSPFGEPGPDLAASGLEKHLGLITSRSNYGIISDPIDHIEETPNGLLVHFASPSRGGDARAMLPLGHIVVMPEKFAPNPHASFLLDKTLLGSDLAPTGTIPAPDPKEAGAGMPMPPRMGDDPRTAVPGLFWAGNAGSFMANVNVSVAQGQGAGFLAASELGAEDLRVQVEGR